MLLAGKVAVVTGATRGIGRAIALGLAQEGADIVVAARSEVEPNPKLPGTIYAVAEEVRGLGRQALPVKTNVAQDEDVERLAREALHHFGHVDILVNNPAVVMPQPFTDLSIKSWDLVWRINIRGPILCTKAFLPHMMERRQGLILNISSYAAMGGKEVCDSVGIPYPLSKVALNFLTQEAGRELTDHGIIMLALNVEHFIRTAGVLFGFPDIDAKLGPMIEALGEMDEESVGRAATLLAARATLKDAGRVVKCREALQEFGDK